MRAWHWAVWGLNPGDRTRPKPLSLVSLPTQPTFARRRKRQCATPNRRARTSLRSNWRSGASRTPCKWRRRADSTEGANMPTTQETPIVSPVGRDTPRVDGPRKVSGMAQYTSDFHFPGMLYAVPVEATIANGRLVKLDTAAADKFETAKAAADAVRATYAREKPNVENELKADDDPDVVATTFGPYARLESQRGDAKGAFTIAPVKLDQTYVTPAETHNPLELHATTAIWEGSTLTM